MTQTAMNTFKMFLSYIFSDILWIFIHNQWSKKASIIPNTDEARGFTYTARFYNTFPPLARNKEKRYRKTGTEKRPASPEENRTFYSKGW